MYQNQKKKLNCAQKLLDYIKCHKDFSTLKLKTLKHYSVNIDSFFFSSSKVPPSIGMPCYWH